MNNFWKGALGVAGIGAIAFFTFLSLYKQWLTLKIFANLTSDQTFILMLVFLLLTFFALIAGVVAWLRKGKGHESEEAALHRLEQTWKGVNYIDCENLIGPDVNNASNALEMTSIYWRNGFISRRLIVEKYKQGFCELFEQIDSCDKQVPGYNKPKKYCRDFISPLTRVTYLEMKKTAN